MSDRPAAYLFITSESILRTGFSAQVLEPLQDLARNGLVFDLFAYRGMRGGAGLSAADRSRVADVAQALSPGRLWIHTVPKPAVNLGMTTAATLAAVHLAPSVLGGNQCVCHCRGHMAGLVGVRLKALLPRCRIVFDVRGDIFAEAETQGLSLRKGLREEVSRLVESACRITCVSESFRRQIVQQYPRAAHKISVIPCTASAALFNYDSQTRHLIRDRLGLDHRLVLVYCGALAKEWQVADQLMRAFRDFRAVEPRAHLLVVTPDVDLVPQLAARTGIGQGDVTVVKAGHSEVPGYLMAADVGLLLRRRDSVNSVASPTKLAEYLMTGLPVVATEGIGDTDSLFSEHSFGTLVRDLDDEAATNTAMRGVATMAFSEEDRFARAQTAARLLSSEAYLPKRLEVYSACVSESV